MSFLKRGKFPTIPSLRELDQKRIAELETELESWKLLADGRAEGSLDSNGEPTYTPQSLGAYLIFLESEVARMQDVHKSGTMVTLFSGGESVPEPHGDQELSQAISRLRELLELAVKDSSGEWKKYKALLNLLIATKDVEQMFTEEGKA